MARNGKYVPELVWCDPPNPQGGMGMYAEVLKQVKARPNTWARIRLFDSASSAYSARKMLTGRITDNGWEFKTVTKIPDDEEGRAGIWARFNTSGRSPRADRDLR